MADSRSESKDSRSGLMRQDSTDFRPRRLGPCNAYSQAAFASPRVSAPPLLVRSPCRALAAPVDRFATTAVAILGLAARQRIAVRRVCVFGGFRIGCANAGSLYVGGRSRLPIRPQDEHSRRVNFQRAKGFDA